ncbi:MAG: hypothetical protein V5B30_19715 [Candidatus Accumulibacter delftensis]
MLWLLLVLPAIVLAGVNWHELTANLSDQVLSAHNLFLLWLVYPLIKALHELGHAYAVKSGDGEVHEMGIMLLVLAPIPYVDATASGAFRNKWRRAMVGAAGMLVELFLAAIAMAVWVMVEPGLVRSIAFNVLFVAGASTLLFNGNPLLRYDGYYVLADLIEIANLGNRSNQYWQWLAKRYLFGITSVERPPASLGERRWFLFYGAASFVYRTLVMIVITLFIAGEFFFVGVVLALWAATTMFVLPIGKGLNYVISSPELQRHRTRARLVTFGSLAVFVLFVLSVPMPLRTHAEGVVWVPENAEVRAAADGLSSSCWCSQKSASRSARCCWSPPSRRLLPRLSRRGRGYASSRCSTPRRCSTSARRRRRPTRICAGKEVPWRAPKRNSIHCWWSPPYPAPSSWRGRRTCRSAS